MSFSPKFQGGRANASPPVRFGARKTDGMRHTEQQVVVAGAARTPIGKFGGALKDLGPTELGAIAASEAIKRSGLDAKDVDHLVFGNVIHTEASDMYLARVVALRAGLAVQAPALTVNRLCGSGLEAIASGAQEIMLENAKVVVAGGAEVMSRAPYWLPNLRWGQRMGESAVTDVMVGALTDPFNSLHMGVTAENIAARWAITRADQDELAAESHRRAVAAVQSGRFIEEIVPVTVPYAKAQVRTVDADESPRADATVENLAKLKPAFDRAGCVTAGNASSINDGAAAVVLMEEEAARSRGLTPLGKFIDCVSVGG
jgi:acetyl-CoA C-acetyltransferase